MKPYEEVFHTADLAARIYGRDLNELFENAAFSMFDMMADLKGMGADETVGIEVDAPDDEALLISWLNELLYISFDRDMLFAEFNVRSLEGNKLQAEVKGRKIVDTSNRLRYEIKAATYHDVEIQRMRKGYMVTVVFDI